MSQSSRKLAEKMKWIVTRYPKPPGQLIALGAILSNPEDPETRLNRHEAIEIEPQYLIDESLAVQRVIHAGASNNDGIMLKVTQLLLNASLGVNKEFKEDKKTEIDALNVSAKIFLPDKDYMNASIEAPGVQEYVKKCNFSKTLYMIIGVASAKKLSINEVSSKKMSVGGDVTFSHPVGPGLGAAIGAHYRSCQVTVSELEIEQECDFAYRIREFTYWKYRKEKVKMKGDRNAGALFRTGGYDDHDGSDDDDDDDDDDDFENVAVFNELKENDVARNIGEVLVFET